MSELKRIDPRGPRFGAAITSVFSILAVNFTFTGSWIYSWVILWILLVLFSWSVFLPGNTHPYSIIFRKFVRPRLSEPKDLEDPRPPHFAQKVGLSFAIFGVVSGFVFVPGVQLAAIFIFLASFLNAFFGLCLGCQMYLGLKRLGVIRG